MPSAARNGERYRRSERGTNRGTRRRELKKARYFGDSGESLPKCDRCIFYRARGIANALPGPACIRVHACILSSGRCRRYTCRSRFSPFFATQHVLRRDRKFTAMRLHARYLFSGRSRSFTSFYRTCTRWMHNVGNRSRLLRISLFSFLGNETVCFTALRYTREARIIQWVWNYAAKVYDRMTY